MELVVELANSFLTANDYNHPLGGRLEGQGVLPGVIACFDYGVSYLFYLGYCISEGSIQGHGSLAAVDLHVLNYLLHVSHFQLLVQIFTFQLKSQAKISLGAHALETEIVMSF